MKPPLPDLRRLQGPLVAGALAIVTSASLIAWTNTERDTTEALLRKEMAQLAEAREQHAETRQTDTDARTALRQLSALQTAGLLTPADRQGWQTHLHTLRQTFQLDRLDWEISPLQPFTPDDPAVLAKPTALVASTLRLHGEVAHEEQLLRLIQRPPANRAGLFVARHCRLARRALDATEARPPALSIDCEIDWISLRLPDQVL